MSAFSRMVSDAFAGRNGRTCGAKVYRVTTTDGHKFKTAPSLDPITTAEQLANNMENVPSVPVKVPKDGPSVNVGAGYNVQEDSAPFSGADIARSIREDYAVEQAALAALPTGGTAIVAPPVVLAPIPAPEPEPTKNGKGASKPRVNV